jgi:hypothetical protein
MADHAALSRALTKEEKTAAWMLLIAHLNGLLEQFERAMPLEEELSLGVPEQELLKTLLERLDALTEVMERLTVWATLKRAVAVVQ